MQCSEKLCNWLHHLECSSSHSFSHFLWFLSFVRFALYFVFSLSSASISQLNSATRRRFTSKRSCVRKIETFQRSRSIAEIWNRNIVCAIIANLPTFASKMLTLRLYLLLVLISYSSSPTRVIARELYEITTRLDDPRFRFLFHSFRTFVFHSIGKTSHSKTKGNFLQQKFVTPFPCDVNIGRSKTRPTSIHKLRPGGELICQSQMGLISAITSLTAFGFLLDIQCFLNARSYISHSSAI